MRWLECPLRSRYKHGSELGKGAEILSLNTKIQARTRISFEALQTGPKCYSEILLTVYE